MSDGGVGLGIVVDVGAVGHVAVGIVEARGAAGGHDPRVFRSTAQVEGRGGIVVVVAYVDVAVCVGRRVRGIERVYSGCGIGERGVVAVLAVCHQRRLDDVGHGERRRGRCHALYGFLADVVDDVIAAVGRQAQLQRAAGDSVRRNGFQLGLRTAVEEIIVGAGGAGVVHTPQLVVAALEGVLDQGEALHGAAGAVGLQLTALGGCTGGGLAQHHRGLTLVDHAHVVGVAAGEGPVEAIHLLVVLTAVEERRAVAVRVMVGAVLFIDIAATLLGKLHQIPCVAGEIDGRGGIVVFIAHVDVAAAGGDGTGLAQCVRQRRVERPSRGQRAADSIGHLQCLAVIEEGRGLDDLRTGQVHHVVGHLGTALESGVPVGPAIDAGVGLSLYAHGLTRVVVSDTQCRASRLHH